MYKLSNSDFVEENMQLVKVRILNFINKFTNFLIYTLRKP